MHVVRRCRFLMGSSDCDTFSPVNLLQIHDRAFNANRMQAAKTTGALSTNKQNSQDNQKTHSLVSAEWPLVESSILHSSLLHRTTVSSSPLATPTSPLPLAICGQC